MYKNINLQLFANPNTQTTTTPGLSNAMKTYYNSELLENAGPNLVHYQFGKKVKVPQRRGKTIEWRKWNSLGKALTPLEEGVTPDATAMSVDIVVAYLYQYGAYTTISDFLDMTAIDDVIVEAANKHGESAGLTIDTITRNAIHSDVTQFLYAFTDTVKPVSRVNLTANCIVTPKVIAKAVAMLKKKNTPKIKGKYIAIIHPSVEFDLETSEDWIDVHKYAATTEIFEGEIGEIYGVRCVVTSEAKIWKGTGTEPNGLAVYGTLVFGKDAYGVVDLEGGGLEMIIKQKGSGGTADPLEQRSTVGWKVSGYSAKVLLPEYIVRIESCSAFSTEDEAN